MSSCSTTSPRSTTRRIPTSTALRGTTPVLLELAPGHHSVRVGVPRLDKWRTADVQMSAGSSGRLDIDLTR